jgi:hypothetical protein
MSMSPDTGNQLGKKDHFDRAAWESFFDEHAPVIYSVVKSLCPNEETAMEITADFFRYIRDNNELKSEPSAYLVRKAHHFTEEQLASRQIKRKASGTIKGLPLLNMICSENVSLSEAASRLRLTLNQFKHLLQQEFTFLKNNLWGGQDAEPSGLF